MFTGIVTDKGRIRSIEARGDTRAIVETTFDMSKVDVGASIACSGACLTVVEKGEGWFAVDISAETLSKTALGSWVEGTPVNLERSLCLGEELGGHIVLGHVDGVANVERIIPEGDSVRFEFHVSDELARFIAPKGSVTLDGVSLTVNEVQGNRFGVNIIPHTQQITTFGDLKSGHKVNLEIDVLARYVARLQGTAA